MSHHSCGLSLKRLFLPWSFSIIYHSTSHKRYFLLQWIAETHHWWLCLIKTRIIKESWGHCRRVSPFSPCNNTDILKDARLFPYGWHSPEHCDGPGSEEVLILKLCLFNGIKWLCLVVLCIKEASTPILHVSADRIELAPAPGAPLCLDFWKVIMAH